MLPLVVLAVCLSAALSAPSLDPQLDEHWNLWKSWHTKKYHEVMCFSFLSIKMLHSDKFTKIKSKCVCFFCFFVEGGGLEENGVGEEP